MSNTNAPFGFRQEGRTDGSASNFGVATGFMLPAAAACFWGDPLIITAGYDSQAAVVNGGNQLSGVAESFKWVSISQQSVRWAQYWPGNDCVAGTFVEVRKVVDPASTFVVQANGGPVTQANVGQFANFAAGGGGNTANGISSYSLDTTTLSSVQGDLPLKIVGIVSAPSSDPTSQYNQVLVQLVNISGGLA